MELGLRERDLRSAARLCALTVAWNAVLGGAAIVTAVETGSLALAGFGLNAAVDAALSAVLVWRFRTEKLDPSRGRRVERAALLVAAPTLLLAALYIAARAVASLIARSGPEASAFGLAQALASAATLPFLALGKRRLAQRIGSPALRADGALTGAGAILAALALVGLGLNQAVGWWWTDPTAALAIAGFLLAEARRALTGRTSPRIPPVSGAPPSR